MNGRERDGWTREKWINGQERNGWMDRHIYRDIDIDIRNVGINTLDETPLYVWLWWPKRLTPG